MGLQESRFKTSKSQLDTEKKFKQNGYLDFYRRKKKLLRLSNSAYYTYKLKMLKNGKYGHGKKFWWKNFYIKSNTLIEPSSNIFSVKSLGRKFRKVRKKFRQKNMGPFFHISGMKRESPSISGEMEEGVPLHISRIWKGVPSISGDREEGAPLHIPRYERDFSPFHIRTLFNVWNEGMIWSPRTNTIRRNLEHDTAFRRWLNYRWLNYNSCFHCANRIFQIVMRSFNYELFHF